MDYKLYGNMVGDSVVLAADSSAGEPVTLAEPPAGVPEGYVARARYVREGSGIRQVYDVAPAAGSAADAALELARIQAESLSDEDALRVPALYPEWWQGEAEYALGQRVLYQGVLYKCLQKHKPQADWAPDEAPSLWARVLPGQSGEVGEWVRPESTEGYSKGDRVTHNGKTWESLVDANVDEPGTDNGNRWKEVAE